MKVTILLDKWFYKLYVVLSLKGKVQVIWKCTNTQICLIVSYVRVVKVTQSWLALCDPMDCSLPGSSVHRILQAFIRTPQVQALGQHFNVPWPEVNRLWENRSHQPSSQENTSTNTLINWQLQSHLAQDLDQIIF